MIQGEVVSFIGLADVIAAFPAKSHFCIRCPDVLASRSNARVNHWIEVSARTVSTGAGVQGLCGGDTHTHCTMCTGVYTVPTFRE